MEGDEEVDRGNDGKTTSCVCVLQSIIVCVRPVCVCVCVRERERV